MKYVSAMPLKQKSDFNSQSTKLLINNHLYAPSIHCAYYAVFQLMKVVMRDFVGIGYDEIDANVASSKSSEHQYVKREILNFIKDADDANFRKINNLLKDLFQFRIESDYKDIMVDIEQAKKAESHSDTIISYLKSNFHV